MAIMNERVEQAWAERFNRDFDKALPIILEKREQVGDMLAQRDWHGDEIEAYKEQRDPGYLGAIVDRVIDLTLKKMLIDMLMKSNH